MKPQSNTTKSTIIIVIVIALAGIIYFYFRGGSTVVPGGLVTAGGDAESIGNEELSLYNKVNAIKLDTAIFSDPVYKSFLLHDYVVDIPSQPVERANPFAPIPGVVDTEGDSASNP